MQQLGLEVSEQENWAIVSVRGDVDVATAPRLREQIIDLVAHGRHYIVVDLDGVEFLDSTGLGVLVGALKRVKTHEGELRLVCNHPRLLKLFEITGLHRIFAIHDSVYGALGQQG